MWARLADHHRSEVAVHLPTTNRTHFMIPLSNNAALRLLLIAAAILSLIFPAAAQQADPWTWRVVAERTGWDEGTFKFPARAGFVYRLEYATSGLSAANGDWLPTPEAAR